MANRYSVPSAGEAFATSFATSISPYIAQAGNKFAQDEENQFNTWRGQWEKLKSSWTDQQTANAELTRQATTITDQLYNPETTDYTREDLNAHVLSELLLRGDASKTLDVVSDQIWNGAIRTRTQLESVTRNNVNALTNNTLPSEVNVPSAADRETVSLFFAAQPNSGATRPDALKNLTPEFSNQLNSFYNALPEDIRDDITIFSGYRSPELQAKLRANKEAELKAQHPDWTATEISNEAGKWVGSATGSRHTHGNAVDLMYKGQRLDKAPTKIISLIHNASKGTGIHFPLENEVWQAEADGTRNEDYAGKPVSMSTTSNTPSITKFNSSGLPTLNAEMDEIGLGQKLSEGAEWLFGQDKNYYLTTAQRRFRQYLEDNGELDLYMKFQDGTHTFKPISSVSPFVIDQGVMRQELPDLFSIKDATGWNDIQAAIEAKSLNPNQTWLDGFNALGERINNLGQYGLERNLEEIIGNPDKIRDHYRVISNLAKDDLEKIPPQYRDTITSLYKANLLDETTYSDNPVVNELTKLQLAASEEAAKNKQDGTNITVAKEAYEAYRDNTLPIVIENEMLKNPESSSAERIAYLVRERAKIDPVKNKEEYQRLTKEIDVEFKAERISNAAEAGMSDAQTRYVRTTDAQGNPDGGWQTTQVKEGVNSEGDTIFQNAITGESISKDKIVPVTKEKMEERTNILSTITADERQFNKRGLAMQSSMGIAMQIVDIARTNPDVVRAPTTYGLVAGAKRLGNEIDALINVTGQFFENNNGALLEYGSGQGANAEVRQRLNTIEALLNEMEQSGVSDKITQFNLLKARQLLLIYQVGSLEGQSGTAMSNKDFDRLKNAMTQRDPVALVTNLHSYFNSQMAQFDSALFQLNNNSKVQIWEQDTGLAFFPKGGGFTPLGTLAENTFNDVQKRGYQFFTSATADPNNIPPTSPQGTEYKVGDTWKGLGKITEIGDGYISYSFDGQIVTEILK